MQGWLPLLGVFFLAGCDSDESTVAGNPVVVTGPGSSRFVVTADSAWIRDGAAAVRRDGDAIRVPVEAGAVAAFLDEDGDGAFSGWSELAFPCQRDLREDRWDCRVSTGRVILRHARNEAGETIPEVYVTEQIAVQGCDAASGDCSDIPQREMGIYRVSGACEAVGGAWFRVGVSGQTLDLEVSPTALGVRGLRIAPAEEEYAYVARFNAPLARARVWAGTSTEPSWEPASDEVSISLTGSTVGFVVPRVRIEECRATLGCSVWLQVATMRTAHEIEGARIDHVEELLVNLEE